MGRAGSTGGNLAHAPDPQVTLDLGALTALLSPFYVACALIAVNVVTFALFGIDKARAVRGTWRVRESTLLTFALLGGTPGAYAGRRLFRHKTRKEPFSGTLFTIAVLQAVVLGAGIGWLLL